MKDTAVCPVCNEELSFMDEIITTKLSDHVVGCTQCLARHDAMEWLVNAEETFAWSY